MPDLIFDGLMILIGVFLICLIAFCFVAIPWFVFSNRIRDEKEESFMDYLVFWSHRK